MKRFKILGPGLSAIMPFLLITALFLFRNLPAYSAILPASEYTINATGGPGGDIFPSGTISVDSGANLAFTINADIAHNILDVRVDGVSVGAVSSYEFSGINSDHIISATFSLKTYTVTSSAGEGGNITPAGETGVSHGDDLVFSISAKPGYEVTAVLVDGLSVGAVSSYEFSGINSDHIISATFSLKTYTVTSSAGEGGNITPAGELSVTHGSDQAFTLTAKPGYEISDVLVDGLSQGPRDTYTFTNTTSNHTISASFKKIVRILGVSIPNKSMKIGDVITANISVSDDVGISYVLISGSVGGYILKEFRRVSTTIYVAEFTIDGGGNSFTASQAIPVSDLIISDGKVMSTAFNLPIVQDSDPIDAQAPAITKIEVLSMAVGVGGRVKLTITADGSEYSAGIGTVVNGIAVSSSRLSFTELSNGLYELEYMVASGDNIVAPGALTASIVFIDRAGNIGSNYQIIEPNTLEIYTALPEATLVGPANICEGAEAQLSVHLRGRSPWSFDLFDGISKTTFTNITSPDFKISLAPVLTTLYKLSSVKDVNGVENLNNGEFLVTVDALADVEIINLAVGYNVKADPVKLQANISGGIFSGPGVVSATGLFYPGIADTVHSPHTIQYTYTNKNGCISTDSKLVYVLGNQGVILMPGNVVCKNEDPLTITVLNVPAAAGSFRLLNSVSKPVAGLTDHGDKTATLNPAMLVSGNYIIEYQYSDVISHYIRSGFTVESLNPPRILNLDNVSICKNEAPFTLQSDMPNVIFEGPGVSGNKNQGFKFDPSLANAGSNWITCTTESASTCRASTRASIFVKFVPDVKFALSSSCMPEGGELVSFDNQTNEKLSIESWSWNFGDPASGTNNLSKLLSPTHHYQDPGLKTIILKASTLDACTASYTYQTIIDSKPVADFDWVSDCFVSGSAVQFVNRTTIGSASVDTVIWTFKSSDGMVLEKIGSHSVTDTIDYRFPSPGKFLVSLYSSNIGSCYSELEKELELRPTIGLDHDGYFEDFDKTEGIWTVRSDNQLESWVWGVPDFTGYIGLEGDRAWYTQLPSGISDYNENSWIQSPCFDFKGMDRPLIRMDIMRSFFPYLSGAVLQYRDAINGRWFTIGEGTPGINWYNVNNIINKPGGSNAGWGLEVFNPDSKWVTAVHDLDSLTGKGNVSLRIVLASNEKTNIGNQGFAVNNVNIAERSKVALLEYFTNSSDANSRMADDVVDAIADSQSKEVVDLQYHMAYPGVDIMYQNNPAPSSIRSLNYGVSQVPFAVIDGGSRSDHRIGFQGFEQNTLRSQLHLLTLEKPAFDIDLTVDWTETGMEASTVVTCLADRFDENVQLYLVVFESSVTAYTGGNGDQQFRNVVLDMLPTPTGKLLGDKWRKGSTDSRANTWFYVPYIEDINDLAVVAFLQDRTSKRILQVAVDYRDKTVGVPDQISPLRNLTLYPNPADQIIYVNLGSESEAPGRIELLEISGRAVLAEPLPAGYQVYQVGIEHLNPGMYLLRWVEGNQVRGVSKFVKMR